MSAPLLTVVAAIYSYVAWEQFLRGNNIGVILWLSYATGNIALIWHTK
jgi:hypothetical protein